MLKKFISTIVILAMCFSLLAMNYAGGQNVTENNAVTQKLDSYMTALQNERNFHGSILVAKDGKILLQKGYGMSDIENNVKIDKDTRFAIGSVTKQFTAMAIMQLYEKGKLSLSDKLSKYIPDYKDGNRVTIHNLLTHSSGIYNFTNLPELYKMKPEEATLKNVIALFKNKPLNFTPGTKFEYSNSGYVLLTYIIEKVSGISYDKYLDKNIFKPLGMKDTGDCYQNNNFVLKTKGYSGFLETEPVDDTLLKVAFGAGELYSTTGDLYKWDRALYTEKLLKKANLQKMFIKYTNMSSQYYYGYGFMSTYTEYGNEIMHTGGTLSFTSIIGRYIDKNVAIIALVNNSQYDVYSLEDNLADITFGKDVALPSAPKEAAVDKNIYNTYAGNYTIESMGTNVEITTDGSHIFAEVGGQEKFEIFPSSDKVFFCKKVEAEITFKFDVNNKLFGFTLHQNGIDIFASRGEDSAPSQDVKPLDQSVLDSYVGNYDLGKGTIVTITTENGHLYAQITGQDKYEIFSKSETSFYYKIVAAEINFNKNSDGVVDSLTIKQNGMEFKASKVK